MLKKIFLTISVVVLSILTTTPSLTAVTGSELQAEPAPKYGVIDMQSIILNVEEGKSARAKLEKEIKAKQDELLNQKKELDKLNKDWQSQSALLSEAAKLKKQQEFQQKFLGLRNEELTFQSEIKRKEQKATQNIAVKVTKIVNKLAEKQNLEAVFEANTSGLLYIKNPVNLTKKVIDLYEKQYKKNKKVAKKETK